MALSFCILGPLEVREDGRELILGTGRQRALLALLLVHANEQVSSERLIDELWSGRPPPSAQKALQGYVSQLRRAVGADTILTRGSGYVLVSTDTDAGEFERLTKLAAEQEADEAILTLQRALALWRGRAFEEFEYEDWPQLEIARLSELRLSATEQRIDAELELGDHTRLVPELEVLVADHPLRERLRGQLMVALYRSGRHADALDVHRRGRQALHDELGLEPSPFLAELERQILSHDPILTAKRGADRVEDIDRPEPAETESPPLDAEKLSKQHPLRRRSLRVGMVAAAIAGVVAATITLTSRGGSAPSVVPNSVIRIDPKTMKVTQVVPIGDAPDLVIVSGGYLWITSNVLRDSDSSGIRNAGDHTVTRVDPATSKADVVGGGIAPCGLTADPSGDVWVANCFTPGSGQTSNVVRVDAAALTFEQTLPVPGGNSFYRGLAYGGGSLWVADVPGVAITQVDPRTGAKRTIPLASTPGALAWSEGYGDLWITNFVDGSLTRLHAATGATQTVDSALINPASVVVDGSVVWVADWSAPHVVRLNAIGRVRPRPVPLPIRDAAACVEYSCVWAVAAGAGAVWATTPRDGALWRIDPKTNAVSRVSLPYPAAGVAAGPNDVWVTLRTN